MSPASPTSPTFDPWHQHGVFLHTTDYYLFTALTLSVKVLSLPVWCSDIQQVALAASAFQHALAA